MNNTDSLIRLPVVMDRVGLKRTAIYKKIKLGEFPKQIRLGVVSAWSENEINQWIEQQKAMREAA